jgi:hypothetical protein
MRSLPLSALIELARSDFVHDPAARAFLLAVGSARGRGRLRLARSWDRLCGEMAGLFVRAAPLALAGGLIGPEHQHWGRGV